MTSFVASLHYLALGLGIAGLLLRQMSLKMACSTKEIKPIFYGDNLWGIAALLWITTGLARAFGGLEKGTEFYLQNHWFHLKMSLFLAVFVLEIYPMVTLIKWRTKKRERLSDLEIPTIKRFILIGRIELLLITTLIFVASNMARSY